MKKKEQAYQRSAEYINTALEGNYLLQPGVIERLNKAEQNVGELSRLFNNLAQPSKKESEILFKQFFQEGYALDATYRNMHQLVQTTLKQMQKHQDVIIENLPEAHKDLFSNPQKLKLLLDALVANYALQLNEAFDHLPENEKAKQRDNFMAFRTSMDEFAKNLTPENIFSEQWLIPSVAAVKERNDFLGPLWEMNEENVTKKEHLSEVISETINDLTAYLNINTTQLGESEVTRLNEINKKLNICNEKIRLETAPFFETHAEIRDIQRELVEIKRELKESRENILVKMVHQITKLHSPSNTISGINAKLDKALTHSDPGILPQTLPLNTENLTQIYKDQLRKTSIESTTDTEYTTDTEDTSNPGRPQKPRS